MKKIDNDNSDGSSLSDSSSDDELLKLPLSKSISNNTYPKPPAKSLKEVWNESNQMKATKK